MSYEIIRRQTTFWDVRSNDQKTIQRVHFLGKVEFRFSDPRIGSFSFVEQHPLLIDYQYPWTKIYLARPAVSAPAKVLATLERAIAEKVGPWREPSHYLNSMGALELLREGYGQLLEAPEPIGDSCAAALSRANVRFTVLSGRHARPHFKVFVAGANYVVAKDFRVEAIA